VPPNQLTLQDFERPELRITTLAVDDVPKEVRRPEHFGLHW
jgi:hypothetical protein